MRVHETGFMYEHIVAFLQSVPQNQCPKRITDGQGVK